ncbi:hypothetical protein Tco_0497102 [Tanacetum coccineum]
MVPKNEKLLEAFIGGLPRCIEGNVTASKPQTLEEAINISKRSPDQVLQKQQGYKKAYLEMSLPLEDIQVSSESSSI